MGHDDQLHVSSKLPSIACYTYLQACLSATTQPSAYIEKARVAGVEDIFNTRRLTVNILHCLPRLDPILRRVARVTEGCGLELH